MNKAIRWTAPVDHPAYAGHFPGTPILPGALLLDIALHAMAAATGIALDSCTIHSVKFLSPASPGDDVVIEHSITAGGTLRFEILADVGVGGVAGRRKIASGSILPGLQN